MTDARSERAAKPSRVLVRPEQPGDEADIREVHALAFAGHPDSQGREGAIVDGLRRAQVLVVSLVATLDGSLVGHVAFSRVVLEGSGSGWYGLGPLAVRPGWQRRGIGSTLVERGLAALRQVGAAGCVLLGDVGYYGRFGFAPQPRLVLDGAPPEHVLGLAFGRHPAEGEITFHSAFYDTV